jgi:hypothetical protein
VANGSWISKQAQDNQALHRFLFQDKESICITSSFINSTATPNEVQGNFDVEEWSLETERQDDVSDDRDSV